MLCAIVSAVVGTVTGTSSRWAGDVIVTEAEVRDAAGATVTVVQLGGSVGGLGMTFSHQPAVVHEGDTVTIDVAARRLIGVAPATALATPAGGTATYGVQRTAKSGTPLWRSGGCIELTYDAASIDAAQAKVLDAAFAAWSTAALGCGRIVVTSTRRAHPPSARDELATVTIRTDRWCNPGNPLVPEVCYAKDASAVTRLLFVDDPSDPDDGEILDADIELDGVDYVLAAPGAVVPPTTLPVLDLQAVATHEAGHALGLAHDCGTGDEPWPSDHAGTPVPPCANAGPDVRAATMYYAVAPGDLGPRSVEAADVAGICELARDLQCEPAVTGGCHAARGETRVPLLLLAIGVAFSSRRRGAGSRRRRASTRRRCARDPTAG